MRRYSPPYYSPPRRGYGGRPRSPPIRGYGGEHGRRKEQNNGSLLVRNIPLNCRAEDLRVPFERYGVVRDVYLPKNYYTGLSHTSQVLAILAGYTLKLAFYIFLCVGMIKFVDPYEAAEAQYHMNGQIFAGREISVVVAAETRKRPEDMRRRSRTSRGPSGYEGPRSSYYGRSRSRSRSRSPRYPTGSRSRHRSRSYSPAPRRRSDYSLSPERRVDHRSPRDPPLERDARHVRRSYSPGYENDADRNGKGYAEKPAYDSEGARGHWKSAPGRVSRSPSGSRSRSADISPRPSR